MKIYKNALVLMLRSKILLISIILTTAFIFWQTLDSYGSPIVTVPLGNAMIYTIYAFIMFMLISFEYMKKLYNNGVAEAVLVTGKGKKRENIIAAFLVMTTFSILIAIIVALTVLKEYVFYKIDDPGNEYKIHIIVCTLVYYFLVTELAILIGTTLAILKRRVLAYVLMTSMILAVCPFASKIASIITESCLNGYTPGRVAFNIISNFYIIPRFDIDYLPEAAFGESLMPDRIFIILFWIFLMFFFIGISRRKSKVFSGISLVMAVAMMVGYRLPVTKMSYGMDFFYGGENPQERAENAYNKEDDADYKITKYDMELSILFNLSAKVDMTVSKSLDEYKMTLCEDYIVKSVSDQDGDELEFCQDRSYLSIRNTTGKNIKHIVIKYSGYSPDYYSCYQCCFLPAYFLYYPRAGYICATDETYGFSYYSFVDKDTEFSVKVDSPEKYISNLPLENGVFSGKCDGFTLVKGFYKIKDLGNSNKLVYPYLDNFIIHDGKMSEDECWVESFEFSSEELKKDNVTGTILFYDSALSMNQGWAYGDKQYFIASEPPFYMSFK